MILNADPNKKGLINWFRSICFQILITFSIFSGLQIFFGLDALIFDDIIDIKKIIFYSILFLISATKLYKDWIFINKDKKWLILIVMMI